MPVVSSSELSQRRQEILDGARRCFAEHGYE
ncbi:MAG: TetR family transcriptional regulator, partial [Corynebacterium matruchotii]